MGVLVRAQGGGGYRGAGWLEGSGPGQSDG